MKEVAFINSHIAVEPLLVMWEMFTSLPQQKSCIKPCQFIYKQHSIQEMSCTWCGRCSRWHTNGGNSPIPSSCNWTWSPSYLPLSSWRKRYHGQSWRRNWGSILWHSKSTQLPLDIQVRNIHEVKGARCRKLFGFLGHWVTTKVRIRMVATTSTMTRCPCLQWQLKVARETAVRTEQA